MIHLSSTCGRLGALAGIPLALLLTTIAVAEERPIPEDWEKLSDQRFEKVKPGHSIIVDNSWGNVYARFGGYDDKVEILTTTQRIDRDYPGLVVDYDMKAGDLHLRVRPEKAIERPEDQSLWRDRVDLVVFAPKQVEVRIRTTDGDVEAKGLKSDLQVQTERGSLSVIKHGGAVSAKSAHGDLSATLTTGATQRTQQLETTTGKIQVMVWEDIDLDVDLATSGQIITDFSIDIDYRRLEEPGKYGRAKINAGGPKLIMRSKRGDVRIGRLPRDFKPREGEGENVSQ